MSDTLAEIKRLYYAASRTTIAGDFDRAIDLLKSMSSETERERATVFMQGLAEMKAGWTQAPTSRGPRPTSEMPAPKAGKRNR